MLFKSEFELEKSSIPFLDLYMSNYCWQVPLHNRVIDLAALDHDGYLIGIEFKLKDWKRALNQALKSLNSFDYVYICVPGGKYLYKLREMASELGIGVMIYDENQKTIKINLEAKKITHHWEPNKEQIKHYLKTRGMH